MGSTLPSSWNDHRQMASAFAAAAPGNASFRATNISQSVKRGWTMDQHHEDDEGEEEESDQDAGVVADVTWKDHEQNFTTTAPVLCRTVSWSILAILRAGGGVDVCGVCTTLFLNFALCLVQLTASHVSPLCFPF